jgi:hypothetical protein
MLVHRGMLPSQLHAAFETLGRRLEQGRERLIMTGMLQRGDDASPFSLTWELPGRVRLVEQRGIGPQRVLVSDGQSVKSNDRFDESDRRMLEFLVFDSAEHLFLAQASGKSATRILGSRFRQDGDLANTPYDLVETTEEIGSHGSTRQQTRTYYFNSDTHLLERVSYRDATTGSEMVVNLSDWRAVAGAQVAHRKELLQDNVPVLTLVLGSVATGPRVADGAFALPR